MQTIYGSLDILICMHIRISEKRAVLLSALLGVTAAPLAAQRVDTLPPTRVTAAAPDLGKYGFPVLVVNVMTSDGQPVDDALVRIRDAGRIARTNWMGEASLYRVGYGNRRVEVLRLGYAPAMVDLNIGSDTVAAQFVLEKLVDTLSTMWITAARPSMPAANLQEFNRRKRMGIGRFAEDTVFEKHQLKDLVLLLPQLFPGIRAAPDPLIPGKYQLKSTRGAVTISGKTSLSGCPIDVYLDGFALTENVDLLKPTDVAGAEMYSMENAPAQYRRPSGGCGVLLLWSRW